MAQFHNIPPLDIAEKAEQWVLVENCIYESDLWNQLIIVPAGFETDLASIPRIFRFLIIKNGKHRAAAIVHDYLCRLGLEFKRSLADRIFLEAMKISGVSAIQRRLMYWAVALNTSRMRVMGNAK